MARQERQFPTARNPTNQKRNPNDPVNHPVRRPFSAADAITIELIQPDSMPAVVRIVWPTAERSRHPPATSRSPPPQMKVPAEASTTLARIKASRAVTGAACAFQRHSQRKDYEAFEFSRPEHIYWDQASVLAQVGLLDQTGLPVTGVEQVEALAADAGPELFDTLIVEPGSDVG